MQTGPDNTPNSNSEVSVALSEEVRSFICSFSSEELVEYILENAQDPISDEKLTLALSTLRGAQNDSDTFRKALQTVMTQDAETATQIVAASFKLTGLRDEIDLTLSKMQTVHLDIQHTCCTISDSLDRTILRMERFNEKFSGSLDELKKGLKKLDELLGDE